MRAGSLRIAAIGFHFHGMNQVRELDRILNEKHRDVVADKVPVAVLGIELDRKSADIARRIVRTCTARDGREPHEYGARRAGFLQDARLGQFGDRVGAFEHPVRARSARVNDPLRDALVVEMEDLLTQDEVFEQRWTARTSLETVLVVGNAVPEIVGQRG